MNQFSRLSSNGRVAALSVVAALLVAAVLLGRAATSEPRVTLFTGLDLAATGALTESLTSAGIPYQLEDAGAGISVTEGDAARARVALAQAGLPGSGRPGLELFDKPTWGMTDFTQHVTYRRALEGELARTIGTLRGVERAQVHLALPEASALRKLDRPAQAAVVVALKPGLELTPEQVKGITQLVSSSVEDLTADRVAVLDDSGRPLIGAPPAEDATGLSTRQLELQRGVEGHLQAKVERLLEAALGSEAVRVQLAAQLNFDQVERTIEAYDTAGGVLKVEQRSLSQPDSVQGGTSATVLSNEYLNSRTVERIVGSVGGISRLTVSAIVDSRRGGAGGEMLESERLQLNGIIRDAIGFDSTRGDRVNVVALPFMGITTESPLITDPAELAAEPTTSMIDTVSRLAFPVLALVAILLAAMLGFRAVRSLPQANAGTLASGGTTPEFRRGNAAGAVGGGLASDAMPRPETSARVLRSWLTESP